MYICNNCLGIDNRPSGICDHPLGIHDHRSDICNLRLGTRNHNIGIDYQFGLKGGR
jgi:hypothetical protein